MTGRIARWINQLIMGLGFFVYGAENAAAQSPVAVTLLPTTSPTVGEPGVTNISVTGSNFPVGTIPAANITVTLKAGGGASVTTPATTVATVVGTTRRVNFTIPASVSVPAATSYAVTLAGTTSTGIEFQSSNSAALTVNPLAVISTLTPNSGQTGQSLTVTVTAQFSNFLQGATIASFGAGISVVSTKVTDATHLTVNIGIAGDATVGPRTVTLTTGAEVASLTNGFTVSAAVGNPTITDFNPKSGSIGTLVTISGSNLLPNAGSAAQLTLFKQGGGSISLPASSATSTTVTFVVPAGAATGTVGLAVNGNSANTTTPLTIVASSSFSLAVTPPTASLIQGQNVAYTVKLNGTNGFNQLAQLSVSGIPTGVTASFSPMSITAGQTSILTLAAPVGQALISSSLFISGSATVEGLPVIQNAPVTVSVVGPTTTLLGRTVVSDALETPLAGVTITTLGKDGNGNTTGCTGHSALSDAAGNFALTNLPLSCVGPQLIGFDGTTASSPAGKYAGVNLVFTFAQAQVTASPVLVHLPRIDNVETFLVQQNASTNQTHAFSSIPGLSVTVYAGTTFTMPDSSQPNPFPLAAVQVPVDRLPDAKPNVPTMMRMFIVAFQPANATANQPVAVYFPNTINTPPGTDMALMTLDPTHGQMVPYGTGAVSADGTQIVPDPDPAHPGHLFGLVHFDWHGPMPPPKNQTNPCFDRTCPCAGDPVDMSSGLLVLRQTDLAINSLRGSIEISRVYRNASTASQFNSDPFGFGTSHNYNYQLDTVSPQSASVINLVMPDGNQFPFSKQGNGSWVNSGIPLLAGSVMTLGANGAVILRWKDGTAFQFVTTSSGQISYEVLSSITNPNGNIITFLHNGSQLTDVIDPVGRSIHLNYSGSTVSSIQDSVGRQVLYGYSGATGGSFFVLRTVTDAQGGTTRYDYDLSNNITLVTDARGVPVASNSYDVNNRVTQQKRADGSTIKFSYQLFNPLVSTSPVMQTTMIDALGNQSIYRFNPQGFLLSVTDPEGQVRVLNRDANNFLISITGPASCPVCGVSASGDQTFSYDGSGNMTSTADALGDTTSFAYEPTFNKIASMTDPLGNKTKFTYSATGNLLTTTDANNNATSFGYNSFGLVTQAMDAAGQRTTFAYDSFGNLTSTTDPLGNTTSVLYDGLSRPVGTIDSLGRTTGTTYDALGRVVAQTDAKHNKTQFAYDPVSNLLSVTDARGNATAFAYNAMSRLQTRTSPLGKVDTRTYDANGNLITFVDRRGQNSAFSYDVLNRLVSETYQDSSVTRLYDANGRLTTVNDSMSGAFVFTYDLAGRLLSSATPFGEIQYAYDARSVVTLRQVVGQTAMVYSYDAAGNLARAAMPQASAAFAYTPRNQLASLSRANGVSSSFVYDNAARLLSITHAKGVAVIDTESYGYDAVGNRASHSTSMGQSLITQAISSAAYDAGNEQNQFGLASNTFDANGSLLSSNGSTGNNAFVWDSRGRLKSVTTAVGQVTSFTYDYAGNLIAQADNGPTLNLTKSFLLDDMTNIAYESASDGSSYSVLSGRSVDSHLGIAQSSGQVQYGLSDAINSTVATVDQSGTLKSQFFYEPYGLTATLSAYPFQFTGRTPVSGTFHYYRARFFNSATGRFISEDPAGLAGGPNVYSYVGNNPVGDTDPLGLGTFCIINQQTGLITCEDDRTGAVVVVGTGYSGNGPGLNNAAMQCVQDVGPTPTGLYALGPGTPSDLGLAFHLTPQQPLCGNRSRLYIHADNGDQDFSASDGCFVLGRTPTQRQAIQRTGTGYVYVY